ncbi:class I SAM-dependent methyltransferase [Falsiroseomonas sp.]|uniref:class I SAM-dependent methyltransferase n=1 Tax=Falsiroseomonas sp. TaxID=2870721 RepID=UPI0034A5A0E7
MDFHDVSACPGSAWAGLSATDPTAWRPAYIAESAWLEHTPFAAWLMGAAQPSTLVELGTHRGVSFMAFCQAGLRLPVPPRCHAVDTWTGDDHTGAYGSEVFDTLRQQAQAQAPGAELLRMRFDDALPRFPDGSVDILHIDGFHSYDAVAHDFRSWLPKMSRRGIVLFHDTEAREHDFGVWRFWAEVSADRPAFNFVHGHGLGVLAVGDNVPLGLAPLFAARGDAEAEARIRDLFASRGAAVLARFTEMAAPPGLRAANGARPAAAKTAPSPRTAQLLAGADRNWRILEIGPSHAPIAPRSEGWTTTVVDHADREGLIAKYATDPTVDTSRIETVDFVWTGGALDALIPAERHGGFDLLIASHVIEHVPDPIGMLVAAQRLLRPDTGIISFAVPDKRTCFDFFRPPSTTGKMLAAHRDRRARHLPADIFDGYAYMSALNGQTGWGWQAAAAVRPMQPLGLAYRRFLASDDRPEAPYEDCHGWVFTPASFELIILELGEIGLIDWRVDRIVPQAGVEFIVHLRRGRRLFPSPEAFQQHRMDLLRDAMRDLHAQAEALLGVVTPPPVEEHPEDATRRDPRNRGAERAADGRAAVRSHPMTDHAWQPMPAVDQALPSLTLLSEEVPWPRHWLHIIRLHYLQALRLALAMLRSGANRNIGAVRRLASWAGKRASTFFLDTLDSLRTQPPSIFRTEEGLDPQRFARSVAVMVQFSASGTVSAMVLRQIATYRELGFAVVLVSNSPSFPEASWHAVRQDAALVVHRRNRGLDFGAWKDVLPVALERWPEAEELLLVNDSVLGPIRPLAPVVGAMRASGPGFFGLLESIQGGPHLQSWFTLARGRAAIADAAAFIARLKLSRSKEKIIQRGELRMARTMRRHGHYVAAVYGYRAMIDRAQADLTMRDQLLHRPVNPAHHFWRTLVDAAGCPFIKTELVRRNPSRIEDVQKWPDVVPLDSPCPTDMIATHLVGLEPESACSAIPPHRLRD